MARIHTKSLCLLVLCVAVSISWGQRFGSARVNFPKVGTKLPVVTVYDEKGKEFSTKSLRGHYSVLVFGCLT